MADYATEPTGDEFDDYPTYSVVVEDGSRGDERVGRRFNILYVGASGITRTFDVRFLARCLLREIDAIGYHARTDAVFLEAGVIEIDGRPALIPNFLVPVLCAARTRAERRDVHVPGGFATALDLDTGELVGPTLSLDVPDDALVRLETELAAGLNGARDRFVVEDGEHAVAHAVLGVSVGQRERVAPRSRADAALDLLTSAKNIRALHGRGLQAIGAAVSSATARGITWSSTNELIDAIAEAGAHE
jgi:hypothetical protein